VKRRDKVLASALVVGVLGGVTALGIFGQFSATTQNSGNEISTGTVALSDNDAGQAMFNITDAQPGDSWVRCIRVSYSGSLPAEVRTYLQSTPGPLTPYLSLKYEKGTQATSTFPDCTGFTPDSGNGTIYEGPISSALFGNWDSGLAVVPGSQSAWNQGDSVVLRVTLGLSEETPNATQGATTGSATVVWEARNQS
jgi:Camelysin metallo-endopeptidase